VNSKPISRLVMLGAARGMPCAVTAVVEAYDAHGLFRRWPIEYIATRRPGGLGPAIGCTSQALRDFAAVLIRREPTAVHLHTAAGAEFWRDTVFMAAAIAARCPLVLHLHGAGFERFYHAASTPVRALICGLLANAACVIVPCESLRAWVRNAARGAHVLCVPDPVTATEAPDDAARPNLILFLARLEREKGLFELLEAVSRVRAAVPDVRLMCAGEGDRRAAARYAAHLGIADAVHFTGWVGPSGKRALLEHAAVVALPSYDEALPVGLLEAMGAGVPVIASPVGGIPEAVVDGVSGYLVAPGDAANLERLLRRLLLDRELRRRIGAAARESVRLRFSPERSLRRLEEVYAALGLCAIGEPRREQLAF
jgi:glycosyltransferase involved in cell wall biosynthesis